VPGVARKGIPMTVTTRTPATAADTNPDAARVLLRPDVGAALTGRLDEAGVSAVREDLQRLVDTGEGELLLDVSQARVVDSTGLGLLVAVHRRAQQRGRSLVLLDVPARLDFLIRHTRLQRVLIRRASADRPVS
jgi:anti-sigma B factor antagonist